MSNFNEALEIEADANIPLVTSPAKRSPPEKIFPKFVVETFDNEIRYILSEDVFDKNGTKVKVAGEGIAYKSLAGIDIVKSESDLESLLWELAGEQWNGKAHLQKKSEFKRRTWQIRKSQGLRTRVRMCTYHSASCCDWRCREYFNPETGDRFIVLPLPSINHNDHRTDAANKGTHPIYFHMGAPEEDDLKKKPRAILDKALAGGADLSGGKQLQIRFWINANRHC
mmetsp:Transcript_21578/g.27901  ORF Transcript_21578/g.27901 Transcript_21578/m.27901 type:complete len:226 (-) Transcript_21578:138-815(-)